MDVPSTYRPDVFVKEKLTPRSLIVERERAPAGESPKFTPGNLYSATSSPSTEALLPSVETNVIEVTDD